MNIYVLNTLEIGLNSINIIKKHLDIRGVIGLSKRDATEKISGYTYIKPYCQEKDLEFIEIQDYSLSSPEDKNRLLGLDIDILIVSGWQRLVPLWLISHCKVGAIGSHGSVRGITAGRGRSPQNWALLLGKKEFYISIFKIDAGIDSGPIIDTKKFILSQLDDIKTSYYKVSWLTSQMIIDNIKNGQILSDNLKSQEAEARYLPKRMPEDGQIDWSRTSNEINNFVRALTKPYPGAFCYIGNNKVTIYKGRPFDVQGDPEAQKCGEIIVAYQNGDLLVKTADSYYLIEEYNIASKNQHDPLKEGMVFSSCDFRDQCAEIVARHYKEYPELIISDDILNLSKGSSKV